MSAYGRWMYGPWFWPPAANTVYGPIDNPYYDSTCNLDDPATWQYHTDPFCEPQQIPGTPNISVGMEQFNDTPIVNGVAYPKVTLEPKSYRLRILNAANDRFFNFQWYVADPTQGNGLTEVALKASELAAAQTDPNVFPTPDTTVSLPRSRLDPDRHRGRLPAGSGGRGRPAANHLDHGPDPLRCRQRGQALAAAGACRARRRDRRLLEVRRQDPDPLQRRARQHSLPASHPMTTTPAPRTSARLAHRPSCPAMGRTHAPSCR